MLFIALLLALLLPVNSQAAEETEASTPPLRIGVTPVFLNYQTALLKEWRNYLTKRLQRPVRFVQRTTYREITDLLQAEKIDFAWICGFPFLKFQSWMRLAAVPLYNGKPLYRAYLIVPSTDTTTTSILDLKGKIFAHSDPDSNSGYLVPQYQIEQLDKNRKTFFRKSIFTWSHEKVVEAVAYGVTNGGSVDGYIWDTLAKLNPALTARTRIVTKSEEFGFPPLVARKNISADDFSSVQTEFLSMADNESGRALLSRLNLDGFSKQEATIYDGIARMMENISGE